MLFFLIIPATAAATVTGSGVTVGEGMGVGTGDIEGGMDDIEFLGEVGGGFSILLLAPL